MSRSWLFAVSLFAVIGGCTRRDEITQYTVSKYDAIQLPVAKVDGGSSPSTASRRERTLGAIVPHGGQTWFFKLSGDPDRVGERIELFRQFVQSIRFTADDTPNWTLPAGWTQEAGSGMRFATVIADADNPPLELTVIALPSGSTSAAEQVLANVNRWRDQLSLPKIQAAELPQKTETVALPGGDVATLVNYTGATKLSGGMSAPFASGALSRPFAPAAGESEPAATAFTAETPAGWIAGKVGGMRKAAFTVEDGDRRAEITVIDLSRDAGDRLANVNRWRGQLGLDPVEQVQSDLNRIDIGDQPGDFVALTGRGPKRETILGVIVDRGDKTWFFKLHGDTELAKAQTSNFMGYVRSVRWK